MKLRLFTTLTHAKIDLVSKNYNGLSFKLDPFNLLDFQMTISVMFWDPCMILNERIFNQNLCSA